MSDIANNAKITLLWRAAIGLCSLVGTALITSVFAYVKSADSKLTATQQDIAQIKWELPVIKQTAKDDKAEIQKNIHNLEDRLQSMRNLTDQDRREISELKIHLALLKQKLQLP